MSSRSIIRNIKKLRKHSTWSAYTDINYKTALFAELEKLKAMVPPSKKPRKKADDDLGIPLLLVAEKSDPRPVSVASPAAFFFKFRDEPLTESEREDYLKFVDKELRAQARWPTYALKP